MNIKSDWELDVKPSSTIEESREGGGGGEARVSGGGDDSSSEEKGRVSAMEVDSRGGESVENARVLDNEGSDDDVKHKVRAFEESDLDNEMEGKKDNNSSFLVFDQQNGQYDPEDDSLNDRNVNTVSEGVKKGEVYKALLSEFDDFVANEKNGAMAGTSRALSYGFEVGDMVWGKVKSHPWWPGHIFNEAFATSSVRRTRREGHVLVAFFGDSSYGWFDPAELIPFDPHFAEKSQQTNSRNFVKAVEEAADEASRRCGLGLACKCRNPYNFRPATVQGYFAVDVPYFEPGGVYSANQIKKARDGFRPGETLSFVKQLALAPGGCDWSTIDFIKNKATVFAFRKAVFEEFDETYAQAFGVQPSRSPNDKAKLADIKQPTRAPLSGPLVIAEALGGGKSSKKPPKVKDHSKKDRYLLKRRDEPSDLRNIQIDQMQESSSAPAVFTEGSSPIAGGDYVLQKRAPAPHISAKPEQIGFISTEGAGPNEDVFDKKEIVLKQAPDLDATATKGAILDAKPTLDKEKFALHETKGKMGSDMIVGPSSTGCPDLTCKGVPQDVTDGTSPSFQQEGEESAKASRPIEDSRQTELSFPVRVGGQNHSGLEKLQDAYDSSHNPQVDAKHSAGMNTDGGVKRAKVLKRPLVDLGSENSVIREKKKKKKKELGVETNSDHPKKLLATGKGGAVKRNSSGKFSEVSLAPREDPRVNQQKKDVGPVKSSSNSVGTLPMVGFGNIDLELRQLLSDLHALALDPCHRADRNGPSITMHFFLQFRSLVYEKSLVVSSPLDSEPVEVRTSRFPSSVGASDNSAGENISDSTPSKPVKALVRPVDPTKGGRKRVSSDRQEEIAGKRLKKVAQLKSLATEKKAGQRILETQRVEGKEPVAPTPPKQAKPDSVKKMEPSAKLVEPTMLVMKFPPETSLPSVAQLKARFARFGSIDQSAIRVFWKSSTCRVVFRRKLDAQAAYRYAIGNNSLFGNGNVRYILREVGGPAHEAPEPDKGRADNSYVEAARAKDPVIEQPTPSLSHPPLPQSAVQIKSILKKPTGDEAGQVTGGNGGRGTVRVKFMLGGEESRRGEQLMVGNRNNFNNDTSFAGGGAPTSVAMDFNSKNFQKVIPPSSMPIHPLPTQFAKTPHNNAHHSEVASRNFHNVNIISAAPSPQSVDISQQMLNLLTRCNDVVNTVTGLLGYVPYHPL